MADLSPDPLGSPPPAPSDPWTPTPRERGELAGQAVLYVGEVLFGMYAVHQACGEEVVTVRALLEPLNSLATSLTRVEALCHLFGGSLIASNRPSLDPSLPNTLQAAFRRGTWYSSIVESFGVVDTERFAGTRPMPLRDGVGPLVAAAVLSHCPRPDERMAMNDMRREVAEWLRQPILSISHPWETHFPFGWATDDYLQSFERRRAGWVNMTDQQRLEAVLGGTPSRSPVPDAVPGWVMDIRAPQQRNLLRLLWGKDWVGEVQVIRALEYGESRNPRDAILRIVREANRMLANRHTGPGDGRTIGTRIRDEQLQLRLSRAGDDE